jgi:glycosyltransferase involved in cell wall biosynthesis
MRVMAELGVKIDLLTYGQGADVDISGLRTVRIPSFRFFGEVRVGPSILKAFFDLVLFVRLVGLLFTNRYDFVQAHEEAVFLCLPLKPIFRFRLQYDMHSSLPQQLRTFEYTESRLLVWLFRRLEKASLRQADAVIAVSPALAAHATSLMPDPSRNFLIENSLLEEVRLADCAQDAQSRAGDSRFEQLARRIPDDAELVVYAGTFEPYQGLDILVRAFVEVRVKCPDTFLLMIGGTREQAEAYRGLTSELGLSDCCLVEERVDQGTARRLSQRAQVLVSPRSEGNNTPLKIYEQLASGIPLVATRVPSHTQVLDDTVCFLTEPDPPSLATGIVTALLDQTRCKEVVRAALALYESKYSPEAYDAKIRAVLEFLDR